jgi:hypothetical protein
MGAKTSVKTGWSVGYRQFTNLSACFGRGTVPANLKAGQVPLELNLKKREKDGA